MFPFDDVIMDTNFVVTDGSGDCRYDNRCCRLWRQSCAVCKIVVNWTASYWLSVVYRAWWFRLPGHQQLYIYLEMYVHYSDVIMSAMASHITGISIVCSAVCSGVQRKHQSCASLAFVRGIHRWPVDSHHKRPVTWKKFPFDDVIVVNRGLPCVSVWPTENN